MVETRVANKNDIDEVARLMSFIRMKEITTSDIEVLFNELVSSTYSDVMLVLKDGTPAGVATLNGTLKLNRIECRLDDVIVDPELQGNGLGNALIEACSQWAWNKKCYKVEFTSRAERKNAHGFYAHLGYKERKSYIFTKFSPETDYVKTKVI